MNRLFRALGLALSGKQEPVSPKPLGITLTSVEGALLEDHNLPRPQWKVIREWIKQNVAEKDVPQAWPEVAFDWLTILRDRLGGSYAVHQSPHFLLLTSRSRDAARSILGTSEVAVQRLVQWLGPVAGKRGHSKHVILDFATLDSYYDYLSHFYPSDSHTIASAGVFLSRGYQHIALPPSNGMQDTLVHELTHNRLSYLHLPLWLEEGVAVTMERKISGNRYGTLDRELDRKHRAYWTPSTLAAFWDGRSFRNPEGEISHLSYNLAEVLVDLMVQEFPNFMDFVACAKAEDAGQAAAQKCFAVSLNDIATAFLGPGDWTKESSENSK